MHEMGIAAELVRIALEEAQRNGAERVTGLTLRVGHWSGVEVESLRFALEAVGMGTPLEGCRVEIERVPPTFACNDCNIPYEAENRFDPCPRCKGPGGDLVAGDEMLLAAIEVEDT